MVVGFTLAIAYALGQAITWWAVIHSFTIGVITTAILVFSRHFTEALTRTAARGFAGIGTRIAVVQVATLGLLLDGAGVDWGLVSDISALLIGGVIMWHFIDILAILRRSLANSFAMTVPFYLAASAFLVLAIIFAVTANHIAVYDQLIAAHSRAAVWGFAWLSIIGTAVTLVPTIAGATISERAKKRSLTGLSIHGALLFVATLALAVGESRAAGVMIFMMAGAGVLIIHPIISEVLASAQRWSVATMSVLAGLVWMIGACAADGAALFMDASPRTVTGHLVVIFLGTGALQLVTGVLHHLLPVLIGGGPEKVRRAQTQVSTLGLGRFLILNLGGVFTLLQNTSPVHTLGLVLVAGALTCHVIILISAIITQYRNEGPQ